MKRILKAIPYCALSVLLWASVTAWAESTNHEPLEQLQVSIEAIVKLLQNPDLRPPDKREQLKHDISEIINTRFDFPEMAKRSLGVHWRKRSPEEKKDFVKIFSELVQESYIGKIEDYTDQTVSYGEEDIRGNYAAVHTIIKASQKPDLPIIYKLKLVEDSWRVYDVDIEGVSLVSTYREQFNKIIGDDSYEELLERMKSKLEKIRLQETEKASAS